jgi:peptidoglycan hydrolase-like protein with peptidoglycan-binding domain
MGYSQTTGVPCSSVANIITTVPTDCTGAVYSVSTGQACPASTVITTPVVVTTPIPATTTTSTTTSSAFVFTKALKLGSTGTEVIQLQQKLKTLGFYKGKIDGGYGAATEAAVKALQKAHKLTQIGSVGPQTRALLNK